MAVWSATKESAAMRARSASAPSIFASHSPHSASLSSSARSTSSAWVSRNRRASTSTALKSFWNWATSWTRLSGRASSALNCCLMLSKWETARACCSAMFAKPSAQPSRYMRSMTCHSLTMAIATRGWMSTRFTRTTAASSLVASAVSAASGVSAGGDSSTLASGGSESALLNFSASLAATCAAALATSALEAASDAALRAFSAVSAASRASTSAPAEISASPREARARSTAALADSDASFALSA
mmetsp:Transcript_25844/g.70096  ORF Transcript_25844/g.70096 Transcript_25844/m.70096 type:complete len:245 (+) Transcript_25844:2254-2988(+)